jgi:hypothetical protein
MLLSNLKYLLFLSNSSENFDDLSKATWNKITYNKKCIFYNINDKHYCRHSLKQP